VYVISTAIGRRPADNPPGLKQFTSVGTL
jgi:hypothetical protein